MATTTKGNDIKQIKLPVLNPQTGQPTGDYTLHDVNDAVAREAIGSWGKITRVLGVATVKQGQTEPVDGGVVGELTIKGTTVTPQEGDVVLYKKNVTDTSYTEFLAIKNPSASGNIWDELDETEKLGDLAYVNEASGTYGMPKITIVDPTAGTLAATAEASNVTLTGGSSKIFATSSIPVYGQTVTLHDTPTLSTTPINNVTSVGSVPTLTVTGEVLEWTAGTAPSVTSVDVGTSLTEGTSQSVVAEGGGGSVTVITSSAATGSQTGVTLVTALPTSASADAQKIYISGAPTTGISVVMEEHTVTVKP